MKTEIIIPSSGVIDLSDDIPISLNYAIADIKKPDTRNADYSKTITVPGTDNNNQLLAHIFEIGIDRLFNPNHKTNAEIVVDKVGIMKGILRLARINTLEDKKIEYELEFKGRLDDLFTSIKDKVITDLAWGDLDHAWTKTNIQNSWSATAGSGYVYPFIDYGIGVGLNTREVVSFRPATYVKEIWDRIFAYAGFQYSSAFLNTDYFKRQFIPFYNEKFVRPAAQIQNNIFHAHRSTNQSIIFPAFSNNFSQGVTSTIIYNNDTASPSSDAGNVYSTSTGKFTCGEPGYYTCAALNSITIQHNSPGQVYANGYVRVLKNGTPVAYTQEFHHAVSPSPSSYTFTDVPSTWSGFLNTGETIEVALYIQLSNNFNTTFPTVQANFVTTNSYFYNSLSPEYTFSNTIAYSTAVPQNVKMEDFIKSLIKRFNLYFEYDKDTPNKIHIEPRNDYYNTTVQDWSEKLDVSQNVEIQPMGALENKRYIFKDKPDKDWLNERYQSTHQQIKDETYGIRIKNVDNDFLKDDLVYETIFSPTPQYSDSTSDRTCPRIIKVDPVTSAITPVTANMRILYYSGLKTCQPWTFYNYDVNTASAHTTYPYCGHIDDPVNPTLDLNWGVPREIYYIPAWNATYMDNNIYNRFWKQFIDEITDKDSSIVTAWFHLTPADIALVDFRHIYRFGQQNYRLNKIYDYNPVHDGLTKCEFIKTKEAVPFVYSNIPAIGGSGNNFTAEAGPTFPFVTLNPTGPSKGRLATEGTNTVPESAGGGVIVGPKNLIGDNVKFYTLLQSSGNTVIHDNVMMIMSSGVTSTGPDQVWVYNQLVSSGDIYNLTHWQPCPIAKTVAEMQAMATSGTINPCAEYLITDAYGNFGAIRIRGRSTTQIEPTGTLTSGTIYAVGYDLTFDQITHIFDEKENNLIRNPAGANRNGNCITAFPLGNDTFFNNKGTAFDFQIINEPGITGFFDNDFGEYSHIILDASGGSVSCGNIKISDDCYLTVSASSLGDSTIHAICTISLTNTSSLASTVVMQGAVLVLDSSGLAQSAIGAYCTITATGASLQINITDALTVNFPTGSWTGTLSKKLSTFETSIAVADGAFDFIVSTVDYSFCGIINCTTVGLAVTITSLVNFNSVGYTHTVRFYGAADKITFMHDGANIFCKGAVDVVLTKPKHWVDFKITSLGEAIEENSFQG